VNPTSTGQADTDTASIDVSVALPGIFARLDQHVGDAVLHQGTATTYAELRAEIDRWSARLAEAGVPRGATVGITADFSPEAVALLLAAIKRGCICVPLTQTLGDKLERFAEIAELEYTIDLTGSLTGEQTAGLQTVSATGRSAGHEHFLELRRRDHPGLVLFSSGSTGESKAAVHDFMPLLAKFDVPRHAMTTLCFLLFDHIGGVNTLLYVLANGGTVVTSPDRSADEVARLIAAHRVQLLPTSPTFLNLLLASGAYADHDLSSLELVTYGTEAMPESTLTRLHEVLPGARLLQTYGLSEVGILRSQSESSDSLWMRVGGESYQTRVVDGVLHIKAEAAMLGYLNAPSPFTDDGWFDTQDMVEVRGDYLRILGRKTDIINVGGEKVYPIEIESTIAKLPWVTDVVVAGEANAITGRVVGAQVTLADDAPSNKEARNAIREHCAANLDAFKVPVKIRFAAAEHSARFKKLRAKQPPAET
jgi:acyl-coenzyme A synthetase/AMP-(fatty) acid ligase